MKQYVKPDLYYEDFELSTHIATCVLDMANSSDVNNCTATSDGNQIGLPEGATYFNNAEVCGNGNSIDEYCYTKGSSMFTIFNS